MKCPYCLEGKLVGAFHKVIIDCDYCNATGNVNEADFDFERGKAMKAERLNRNMNLRKEAERLGISAVALSKIERGDFRNE